MDYNNSDKLIFILASPAGGGYRLGRIISCFDNVFWYSSKGNGLFPWSIFRKNPDKPSLAPSKVKGRPISKYHFDRRTSQGMIPLLGERIEKFWNTDQIDTFYKENWNDEFIKAGGPEILNSGKSILWVLHDTPQALESKFPNAKIINLVDDDVYSVIQRYLTTTALFPFKIENTNLKPAVDNEVSKNLLELEKVNPAPTYRDYWAWVNYGQSEYSHAFDEEYIKYVSSIVLDQQQELIKKNPKYLTVTWDTLDIESIKEFIGASSIDANYPLLVKG
jgi:hypothetical protein